MRKTKIVCTIGPASETEEKLKEMMLAGMNVARINFSHGSYEEQEGRISAIKKVRKQLNLPVSLLMDTKGPEIRIGKFKDNFVTLEPGKEFTLLNKDALGDETRVSITYKNLYKEVKSGDKILINDGIIELKVKEIVGKDILCKIIHGGNVSNRKSINVPGLRLNLPSLTEADVSDIKYCVKAGVDYIAASFVRKKDDVFEIRKVLSECGGENVKIISKIENKEGIKNFDEILEASDGIMVARGDLGVEISMPEIPVLQKKFIRKCNQVGKPVITATQMLESMVNNVRPTRAEVSDIANAIFDMTSAIMLSAESASGKYPVECIKTMASIAKETESAIDYWSMFTERKCVIAPHDYEKNIAHSICTTARVAKAKAIFAYTEFGNTPRLLAGFLPSCPIYAILDNEQLFRQMGLLWNVYPKLYKPQGSIEKLVSTSIKSLKETNELVENDEIVICGGGKITKEENNLKFNKVIGGIVKI